MNALFQKNREREIGQSLVEVAVFLPVIIILILGVVEVSNLLVTQNRVSAASRAATGFAATNITGDEWKDEATWSASMVNVARNNVTETLELDENRWDIWTIKATVNQSGDGFNEWREVHAYGDNSVMTDQEWESTNIESDILAALNEGGTPAENLQVAATVAYHDRHSLLGLQAFNFGPLTRVRGLNVMRVDTAPPYLGCDIFPITIYFRNISLYPENFDGTMAAGGEMFDPDEWNYPAGGTYHYNDDPYDHSSFPLAVGGHDLLNASRGDIFEAREQAAPTVGSFGWLTWDGDTSATALEASLTYPGNLTMVMPPPSGKVNYDNPHDPFVDSTDPAKKDLIPNIGNWVQQATGNVNKMKPILDSYVDSGRPMQIIVFDKVEGSGSNFNFRIGGFVIVKLIAHTTTASDKRILVEFIDWGDACSDLADIE